LTEKFGVIEITTKTRLLLLFFFTMHHTIKLLFTSECTSDCLKNNIKIYIKIPL